MTPCPSCNRHVRDADVACPFCGKPAKSPLVRAFNTVGGAVTALVLAACYGSPSSDKLYETGDTGPDTALTDADSDGYMSDVDCDDANVDVNPGAAEICDDTIDNDCDTKTDTDDEDCA